MRRADSRRSRRTVSASPCCRHCCCGAARRAAAAAWVQYHLAAAVAAVADGPQREPRATAAGGCFQAWQRPLGFADSEHTFYARGQR